MCRSSIHNNCCRCVHRVANWHRPNQIRSPVNFSFWRTSLRFSFSFLFHLIRRRDAEKQNLSPPHFYLRIFLPSFFFLCRAIFSANPQEEPLIGPASVIVVNDVRHELYPEFLQRTVPYFFKFDKIRRCYKWADVAFVQVSYYTTRHHHSTTALQRRTPTAIRNRNTAVFCSREGSGSY